MPTPNPEAYHWRHCTRSKGTHFDDVQQHGVRTCKRVVTATCSEPTRGPINPQCEEPGERFACGCCAARDLVEACEGRCCQNKATSTDLEWKIHQVTYQRAPKEPFSLRLLFLCSNMKRCNEAHEERGCCGCCAGCGILLVGVEAQRGRRNNNKSGQQEETESKSGIATTSK